MGKLIKENGITNTAFYMHTYAETQPPVGSNVNNNKSKTLMEVKC